MEAFAYSDFRRFQLARVVAVLGYAAQSVAVAWQVWRSFCPACCFCCLPATWPIALIVAASFWFAM